MEFEGGLVNALVGLSFFLKKSLYQTLSYLLVYGTQLKVLKIISICSLHYSQWLLSE